jgi:hypothetical protein
MYCILISSSKRHYKEFYSFLLNNKPNNVDIIVYDDISNIDWEMLSKYDYTIMLSRYSYVNIYKAIEFCEKKQPNLAGLSTYWGVGFPYMLILSKETAERISNSFKSYGQYFDNQIENLFFNIFITVSQLSSIRTVLFQTEQELSELFIEKKIYYINNLCYINNINYIAGPFHSSIFVSFDDTEDRFITFLEEYHSGTKHIVYQNQHYILTIGKHFFIIKQYHICLLNAETMIYWDNNTNSWKLASHDLKKELEPHIRKYLQPTLDQKPTSRYYTNIRSTRDGQATQSNKFFP